MAGNGTPDTQFLAPPAVTALRQEARSLHPKHSPMARTLSDDMREQREDLKEAAEQTLNVIMDLGLDGRIKWVSPSWRQVVGTSAESVEGQMISNILISNKDVFRDAIELMKEDDSRSRFIRFAVRMGPNSVLKYSPGPKLPEPTTDVADQESPGGIVEGRLESAEEHNHDVLNMEAQGIMVYDRSAADGAGHVGVCSYTKHNVENRRADFTWIPDDVDAATVHGTARSDN